MKNLRHPIRALREPFGTAGLIVACIALAAALGGTALAVKGALTGKQRKEVEKIAKKVAGTPGPAGAPGPAGQNGVEGEEGAEGKAGKIGKAGKAGKGATVTPIAPGGTQCAGLGGALVEGEGSAEVCSGKEGETGKEGSPWTAGGTLPPGATETGTWAFTATEADTGGVLVPLSLSIPLPFLVKEEFTHFGTEGEAGFSEFCPGSYVNPAGSGNPEKEAKPGQFCVYLDPSLVLTNTSFEGVFRNHALGGTSRAGALLKFSAPSGPTSVDGSFSFRSCTKESEPVECPAGS